jgi:hypothetical protein
MTDITTEILNKNLYLKYKRKVGVLGEPTEKYYYHCTGHSRLVRCKVDHRSDTIKRYLQHRCFTDEEEVLDQHFERLQRRDLNRHQIDTSQGSLPFLLPGILSTSNQNWLLLQAKYDLSFLSVTSPIFHEFSRSLIQLGQENPLTNPLSLFPGTSNYQFRKMREQFSIQLKKSLLESLRYSTVSICMDGTVIGDRQFVIIYAVTPSQTKPLFFSLREEVRSQENYAECAASIIEECHSYEITVGAFCTDGLIAQVQALDNHYDGFVFFLYSSFQVVMEVMRIACAFA